MPNSLMVEIKNGMKRVWKRSDAAVVHLTCVSLLLSKLYYAYIQTDKFSLYL